MQFLIKVIKEWPQICICYLWTTTKKYGFSTWKTLVIYTVSLVHILRNTSKLSSTGYFLQNYKTKRLTLWLNAPLLRDHLKGQTKITAEIGSSLAQGDTWQTRIERFMLGHSFLEMLDQDCTINCSHLNNFKMLLYTQKQVYFKKQKPNL